MKVFGLTGGIGMGKSAAEQWLRRQRIRVTDSDLLARQIVEPGQPALQEIRRAFGENLIGPDGHLRREELAQIVFSDADRRRKLESITHPRIRELWLKQIDLWRAQIQPLAVVVIPLLFEIGAEKDVDATVCVACSPPTQRRRLEARGWSAEEIDRRNAAQWPIEQKLALADFVIWTEGSLEVVGEQLARVFAKS
jgi:dephospho-CoA kinase